MRAPALVTASAAFVAANLLHTADHVRQGVGGLTTAILVGGSTLTVLAVVVLVLAVRGNQHAPLFAVVVGASGAVGILASHVAPHWSALSDSYPQIGADALSWVVMLIEVSAAVWLAAAGLRATRRSPAPTPQPG
ncbi:MAG: hypothetical protein JWM71_1207 [Solirubrobacteraceae bacterium]|nr:hypothetical protein [Solirubrobacteraceae bacterium]